MSEHRKRMDRALQDVLVPELRRRGFRGSLPHFRRVSAERVDYLSVQYYSAGGSFVVEIAKARPDGKPPGWGRHLPVARLNVAYFPRRLRLGARLEEGEIDHWFAFGPRTYEPTQPPREYGHYLEVARSVLPYLDTQAEPWWQAGTEAA